MTKALTRSVCLLLCGLLSLAALSQDVVADNMLLYQRSIGGWPKHINEVKVNYAQSLTESEKSKLAGDKARKDATIDNGATTKEIRYLANAYKKTGNKAYLQAAEKGIRYLLLMQMPGGGFPQFYPDSSSYRGQITYNDNAMINALTVLWDVAHGEEGLDVVSASLKVPAKNAVAKGIDCILKTQVVIDGKPTVWCAQHDKKTFLPVKARAFELASLSGSESVGILNFLMKLKDPSPAVKSAVVHAVEWLKKAKIRGYAYKDVEDPSQPKGRDRVLVKDDFSFVWARFYDLETGKPLFAGRDGKKQFSLADVEVERRTGYAWYGTWPEKLLQKTYPAWQVKNGLVTTKTTVVVSQDGKGDYTTIQAAIDHLPDTGVTTRIIRIKQGTYNEKIFLTKHNIVLEGEDREGTKIIQSIARDEWRCEHLSDWGVATINIDGNDITLKNLTISNEYGFMQQAPRTVACTHDSAGTKQITRNSHQMALRSMNATRLKAVNCHFRAYAGDTVSPWNLAGGMFYFKDCIMEGGVDFYCPRGWAYAENCRFYAHSGTAAIWHDGSTNPDYKTVLKNCTFDGFKGFKLGRYHKDAQFYLVDCTFSENMVNEDIYLVPTANSLQWGRRIFYANCQRDGGNYAWFADNLQTADGAPKKEAINAAWVFGDRWQPEKIL
ncbi:pectate lyase [Flavisolibacter sp. BT320]|nr:pectate lyase [Flavisolibacter longurius]